LIAAEQFGGPNAGQADQAALAGVNELDDDPMETIVVPPGVSPFTGQVIAEEPAPYIPPPRSAEYGIVGRNQPAYEEPVHEQDYEVPALARLGLIGPDPVDADDETGEIELVAEDEQPPQVARVGGEVDDGEDYYASLFADAPAAATYAPDVRPKPEPVREAEQSWQLDESTREFFPFDDDDDTAAQAAVTADAAPDAAAVEHQPDQQGERGQRDWVGGAWVNGEWVEDAAAYLAAGTTNAEPAGPDLDPPPSDTDKVVSGANTGLPSDAAGRLGSALSGSDRAEALSGPGDVASDGEQDALGGGDSAEIAEPPTASTAGLDRAEPPGDDERFVVDDAAQTVGADPEEPDSFVSPAGEVPDDAPTAEIAAVLDVEVGEPGEVQEAATAAAPSVEADEEYYPASRSPFAPEAERTADQPGDVVELEGTRESARAPELVVPPPSTPPVAIPGLGLVAAQGPRVEPEPGSLEEAMRAEQERPRPRPKESPALRALHDWCRARTRIVPSGFTIQVQVLDPAAPSYRFDLEPPEVHDPEYAAGRLAELLGDLWLAEAGSEQDGWLFARIDAAGRTVRIDRWYDQVPDWWDNPVEPRLDAQRLLRRLYGRGVDWQPNYLQKLHTDAR
jgi:hypothetical protein